MNMRTSITKLGVGFAVVAATIVTWAGVASASADPVANAFASGETSLMTYIGLGIGVIVVVLLAGLGVGLLVKYLRKAVRAA